MNQSRKPIVIAIDGTSASGKSTTARMVAKKLGFKYVDTGAMYRTLAWYCLQKKVDTNDPQKVIEACKRWRTRLVCENDEVRLVVSGYYPEKDIRSAEVSAVVPRIAAIPAVRDWMKKKQRECIKFGNLVMEGRDIGSNVFPETEFKFYLDASPEERARRRAAQGIPENIIERDRLDSQRAVAPLMIPLGARVINNSNLTPEETCEIIVNEVRTRLAQEWASDTQTQK
jgi:cytidylate kinase